MGKGRLPDNVKPTNYLLELSPDYHYDFYEGKVTIDLDILKNCNEISFHTVDMELLSTKIENPQLDDGFQDSKKTTYDIESHISTVSFANTIPLGTPIKLHICFRAKFGIGATGAGFYKSAYTHDGQQKNMLTTQFQPMDCRKAFPCFDEPAMKATFEIILTVDKYLTCLSNMNVVSETEASGHNKRVSFAKSPIMSTYIVAFVIGELNYIESKPSDFRIPVRIYTLPGKEQGVRWALDLSVRTLKLYEELFALPYPLPKLDQVACVDFGGGMENWGLVMYKEWLLLMEEGKSSSAQKQICAEVVQHELAHQWFGNLGFATWMSWYSTNIFFPEWKTWQKYLTISASRALKLDAVRSSHPVTLPIEKLSDIGQIFDAISYAKGSCVIRMIASALGEDAFLEGIRLYIKKHAYSNTKTSDLWSALSIVSGRNVSDIMDTWTSKTGYPVLTVEETLTGLRVQQNRFLTTGDPTDAENETLYPILISILTSAGQHTVLLKERTINIPIGDLEHFKLNAGQAGFYRTLYSPMRLVKFGEAMSKGLLSVEDRIGIISDAAALASSGYQKTSALLTLLATLKSETNKDVWKIVNSTMVAVHSAFLFQPTRIREALRKFHLELISPITLKLGWSFESDDDDVVQEMKSELFREAGIRGNKSVIEAAREMWDAFQQCSTSIPLGLFAPVAVIAMIHSESQNKTFDQLLEIYRRDESPELSNAALAALGYSREPKVVTRALRLLLSNDLKTIDKIFHIIPGLLEAPITMEDFWTYSTTHFEEFRTRFGGGGLGQFGAFISAMVSRLATRDQLERATDFYNTKDVSAFDRQLAQAKDAVESNLRWLERDSTDIKAWLAEEGYF